MAKVATISKTTNASALIAIAWGASLLGVGLTAMMAYSHLSFKELPILDKGGRSAELALDPGSNMLGVPISVFALAFFLALAGLAAVNLLARSPNVALRALQALRVGGAAGLVAGCALYVYLHAYLRSACMVCDACTALICLVALCSALLANLGPISVGGAFRPAAFVGGTLVVGTFLIVMRIMFTRVQTTALIDLPALARMPATRLITDPIHTFGNSSAPETFVLFADGECPFCARVFPILYDAAKRHGNVRLVLKHFPLPSHTYAFDDALGAELAAERGKLWQYENAVYTPKRTDGAEAILISEGWTEKEIAARLTPEDLSRTRVLQDQALGESLGIRAVPVILDVVDGRARVVSEAYVRRRFGQ